MRNTVISSVMLLFFATGIQWIAVHGQSSVIHVASNEIQCPINNAKQIECLTINDLIDKYSSAHKFSSNTTLRFSRGTHIIGENAKTTVTRELIFDSLEHIEISSNHGVGINTTVSSLKCSRSFGIKVKNVTNFKISGLLFANCGSSLKYQYDRLTVFEFNITLWVTNTSSFIAENVTITNTQGVGVFVQNVYQNLTLSNIHLSSNEVNCFIEHNSNELNYSIIIKNSEFLYGDALKPGKYYHVQNGSTNTNKLIGSGGLHIRFGGRNDERIELINNTHHDNKGMYGNIYLEQTESCANCYPEARVLIKGLTSTYTSDSMSSNYTSNNGITIRGLLYNAFLEVHMDDSTFKRCCVVVFYAIVIAENVTIEKSPCFASLDLFEGQHVAHRNTGTVNGTILSNLNITQSSGQHTIKMFQSRVILKNRVHIQDNLCGIRLEKNSNMTFKSGSTIYITNNTATDPQSYYASTLYAEDSIIVIVVLHNSMYVRFENNTSRLGGAITLVNSKIVIGLRNITLLFLHNTGTNGGAIAMYDRSQISMIGYNTTLVSFTGNNAIQKGGAIYVDTSSYLEKRNREMTNFLQVYSISQCPTIKFINNTATLSANNVYGAWLNSNISKFCMFKNASNTNNALLSSDPVRVCICNNDSIQNCSIVEHSVELFPGQKFEIKAVAVGWEFGTVPSIVQARFENTSNKTGLKASQYVQSVNQNCTTLNYKLYSPNKIERLRLIVEKQNIPQSITNTTLLLRNLVVKITVKGCPPGFLFNDSLNLCTCHPFLLGNGIECDIERYSVVRSGQVWIQFSLSDNISESGIAISKYCPHDYCNHYDSSEFNLEYPDSQCTYKRSGKLCGACRSNLSQVFGTSNCKKCSSLWVLLIVPVFLLAGVALVVFIMSLNLTVTTGTINGLILYANIVRANQAIFFPPEISNSFLSWFIAWINLDFGIEACFYDGMDAYAKTWLQFLFPLYIWLIVITIIVLSRRFDSIAKLCEKNSVAVLATLFLLSYAKLLRLIIIILQPTMLSHSNAYPTGVWLYDGNIDYLKGKHIPLFIAALLLLLFLSLPYTAILLTIQWLQKWSEYQVLFWINRLKPLFDAYTGPYKDDHRYWTGLLLLIRLILFLVFSMNVSNDPYVNLLAIVTVLTITISIPFLTGQLYKSLLVNYIEVSFLLNISVLAAVKQYQIGLASTSSKWPTNLSASIAFITFVAIVLKQLIQRIVGKQRIESFRTHIVDTVTRICCCRLNGRDEANLLEESDIIQPQEDTVSCTVVQLREPLLEN